MSLSYKYIAVKVYQFWFIVVVLSLLSLSIDLLRLGYDIWYLAIVYESLPLTV